jgi:hypothetical protein
MIFSLKESIYDEVESHIFGMDFFIKSISNSIGVDEDSSLDITDGYSELGIAIWFLY